jgi:hypothetical protein
MFERLTEENAMFLCFTMLSYALGNHPMNNTFSACNMQI